MFLNWILWVVSFRLESNKDIVLPGIEVEFLTELSLVHRVLGWSGAFGWHLIYQVGLGGVGTNLWLGHNRHGLIETVLLHLDDQVTILCVGWSLDVVLAVPVSGVSGWSWLVFTPCKLSIDPLIFLSSDENIFLCWTFVRSLWTGPVLNAYVLYFVTSVLRSTIIKRLLPIWLSAENRFITWSTASSRIVEGNTTS